MTTVSDLYDELDALDSLLLVEHGDLVSTLSRHLERDFGLSKYDVAKRRKRLVESGLLYLDFAVSDEGLLGGRGYYLTGLGARMKSEILRRNEARSLLESLI